MYLAPLTQADTSRLETGNPVAPNYVFSPGFGRLHADSPSLVVTVPADELAMRTAVAERLGVPTEELVATAAELWVCDDVPQPDCQDSAPAHHQREVVLHPETEIPLQASAVGPVFGTEIITVTAVRPRPSYYT